MPAPGLCGVRDVRIERPDGRNHTGRGCRGGGGRKHIELAGDPEGREINMARRPVAGAARLGSVRLFVGGPPEGEGEEWSRIVGVVDDVHETER